MKFGRNIHAGRYATAWEAQIGRFWIAIRFPKFWRTSGLGWVRIVGKDGCS